MSIDYGADNDVGWKSTCRNDATLHIINLIWADDKARYERNKYPHLLVV